MLQQNDNRVGDIQRVLQKRYPPVPQSPLPLTENLLLFVFSCSQPLKFLACEIA